ncbi:MAG: tRNA lysidine(34) synthetase TilS [Sandarakinorhabdus sp.]|nr:tRNA lysidine(34) synthetase TilS [Sandarakinorhabdus sp.]
MPDPTPDIAALLAAALGRPLGATERLAVAVSGGADSLALLHLAASAFPSRTTALTVDHGLRAASASEAAHVADLCSTINIPHITLRWTGEKRRASLQAAARAARYALMGDWCASANVPLLLTAHHADDQAETLLMQLQRGSGTAGLAGIRAARPLLPRVTLVRPLLPLRRSALAAIARTAGWTAIDDPSNTDPRYARTAARALLAANPSFDVPRIAAIAGHLAQAETALDWIAARAWEGAATIAPATVCLDVTGLPAEIVRRLLVRAIIKLTPAARPGGASITKFAATLKQGGTATLAGVRGSGGEIWCFSRAAPRRKTRQTAARVGQNRAG